MRRPQFEECSNREALRDLMHAYRDETLIFDAGEIIDVFTEPILQYVSLEQIDFVFSEIYKFPDLESHILGRLMELSGGNLDHSLVRLMPQVPNDVKNFFPPSDFGDAGSTLDFMLIEWTNAVGKLGLDALIASAKKRGATEELSEIHSILKSVENIEKPRWYLEINNLEAYLNETVS